jgi:hypothetical protein
MRVSDADRHQVAEVLREAAGEGRIDLDELDQRLEAAYSAKTYADLAPLTADLPTHLAMQPTSQASLQPRQAYPVTGPGYRRSTAILSQTSRVGLWTVGPEHSAFAFMGGVLLDLREAALTQRETVVNAFAVMGNVVVVVNPYTQVVIDGLGLMGDFSESRSWVERETGPDSPVLLVKGLAFWGSVNIKRKAMPGGRSWRRRR